jgi:hypothetical protein
MINVKEQLEAFRFTVKHHGTRTQGEDYRIEQVAVKLMAMVETIIDVTLALDAIKSEQMIIFHVK